MKNETGADPKERRRIVYWLAGAASVLMFWRFVPKAEKKPKMVKMLSEDGQLVEVDARLLSGQSKKLKNDEFHSWVKRKK